MLLRAIKEQRVFLVFDIVFAVNNFDPSHGCSFGFLFTSCGVTVMSEQVESIWNEEYVEILREYIAPHVKLAGEDAQVVLNIEPKYRHRGVIGYTYAVNVRERLKEQITKTTTPYKTPNKGPWRYDMASDEYADYSFFVYILHDGSRGGPLIGPGAIPAKEEATKRRAAGVVSEDERDSQLVLNLGSPSAVELPTQNVSNVGCPIVCLLLDEDKGVSDVVLGLIVDSTPYGRARKQYRLKHTLSLSEMVEIPEYDQDLPLEFYNDEDDQEVKVALKSSKKTGESED